MRAWKEVGVRGPLPLWPPPACPGLHWRSTESEGTQSTMRHACMLHAARGPAPRAPLAQLRSGFWLIRQLANNV